MPTKIESADQVAGLWSRTYNTKGKPDWFHILPFYADDIVFRDSIQEVRGIAEFRKLTQRLASRSKELHMEVVRSGKTGNLVFIEWEMTIAFRRSPKSVLYGMSRLTLNERGMIKEQRDYYDLWGDIFDNIPFMARRYRKFMHKRFG